MNPDALPWQPSCDCDRRRIADPPATSPRSFEVVGLDNVPGRARTWPGTRRIEIDRRWWATLTTAQRDAALAHELAHHDDPSWCERCADARAGARLRYAGRGARETAAALGSIVAGRRSDQPALWGWAHAHQRLSIEREARALDAPSAGSSSFVVVAAAIGVGLFLLSTRSRPWLLALPGIP